jgi:hypothetical protein
VAGHRHACQPTTLQSPLNKIVLILRRACGVILERESAEEHRRQRTEVGQYIRLPPWCRQAVGLSFLSQSGYPDKPPRMRWATYNRLLDKLRAADGVADERLRRVLINTQMSGFGGEQ